IEFNETIKAHFEKEEMDIFFTILKKINQIIDEKK
ncbi:MAG: MarR family transcriptional regulator, partial [Flavobacteriales bacterium]|nr:MarR family transcriptional regulator [Flavobacteriales bacterium]